MSFCKCIKCDEMVFSYEKYCDECVSIFGLSQDESWHSRKENWYGEYNIEDELERDGLSVVDHIKQQEEADHIALMKEKERDLKRSEPKRRKCTNFTKRKKKRKK